MFHQRCQMRWEAGDLPRFRQELEVPRRFSCDQQLQQFLERLESVIQGLHVNLNVCLELPASSKGKRQFIINEDSELLAKYQQQSGEI